MLENRKRVGMAICLAVPFAFLGSCSGSQPGGPSATSSRMSADAIRQEFEDNVKGVMNSPSMKPGSGAAGAPINVSPYVKSAPNTHGHDMEDMHEAGNQI